VESADGVIIASAIYKASFSGLLKICLDVMPQFGLAGKAVLPIGTGGSLAHVLALDYSLRPVLQSMGARHVAQSLFVAEPDLIVSDDKFALSEMSQSGLQEALNNFLHSISGADTGKLLGHPRPPVPCDPAEWAGLLA
jgi:FMN reductase